MWKFMRGKGHQPSAERAKVQKELFQFNKTVHHGFPNRPSAVAWDPKLKLMAVGTRTGSVKVYGMPGVEFYSEHNEECSVMQLFFLPNQGRLISLCDDNSLHLWEINFKKNKSEMEEIKSCSLEGRMKKISTCCLQSNGAHLLIGTEGGNIYLLDVKSFEMTDHIIYQDVVMQNVPDDYKVNPGAVEAISEHPSDPNKILIGYNRGLLVLWDNKSLNADQTYVGSQQLESVSWHRSGTEFMSAHNDGSYIIWNTSDSTKPENAPNTPYGPFPCKAINKIDWKTAKRGDFTIFSGGMPRASYGDRNTVTVINGDKHVVFELTSRIIDFITISDADAEYEYDDPHSLIIVAEEELVAVDLESEDWPVFKAPYLTSLHSSAITCAQHYSNISTDTWEKLAELGEKQTKEIYSQRDWPITGGKLLQEETAKQDLLLTGHEDGTVRFWNSSGVALQPLYKLSTCNIFTGEEGGEQNNTEEEEWPPFRKVGSFDPYSDDPRLAVKKIVFCHLSKTLVIGGTAGQVIVFNLNENDVEKELEVSTVNIVGDRDNFVWKGHDQLTVKGGPLKFSPGFQPHVIMQLLPPAASTALALHSDWGLIAAGTAHGFGLFDYIQKKPAITKCTLNPNDISGVGENTMSRRKSFKKSLRESFRRLRKRRSQRHADKKKSPSPSTPRNSIEEKKESKDCRLPAVLGVVEEQSDNEMLSSVQVESPELLVIESSKSVTQEEAPKSPGVELRRYQCFPVRLFCSRMVDSSLPTTNTTLSSNSYSRPWCGRCFGLLSLFGAMRSFLPVRWNSHLSSKSSSSAALQTDEIILPQISTFSDISIVIKDFSINACTPIVPLAEGETSEWLSIPDMSAVEDSYSLSHAHPEDSSHPVTCSSSQALHFNNISIPYFDTTSSTLDSKPSFPEIFHSPPVATSTPKWKHDRIVPTYSETSSFSVNNFSTSHNNTLEKLMSRSFILSFDSMFLCSKSLQTSENSKSPLVPFSTSPLVPKHPNARQPLSSGVASVSLPAVAIKEAHSNPKLTSTSLFHCSSKETPVTDLDAPTPTETQAPSPPSSPPDTKPVERQVEARAADDALGSMVRCLYLAKSFIVSVANTTPTLWAGTNSGAVYVFTISLPSNEKRKEAAIGCLLGKEIQLKHRAPVIAICIVDAANRPLPEPLEVQNELAKPPDNNGSHRVVICSEEQFKVFTLPSLKPYCKYKLTAHEGSRVRKIGFMNFCSKRDPNYNENCFACLTNQGDLSIFSVPDLRRQLAHQCIRREDINGISSLVFTKNGEGFYLHSSSELQRFSLSAYRITDVKCMLELPEGMRSIPQQEINGKEVEEEKEEKSETQEIENASTEAATDESKEEQSENKQEITEVSASDEEKKDESTGDITIDSVKDHLISSSMEESHVTITEHHREEKVETREVQESSVTVIQTTTTVISSESNATTEDQTIVVPSVAGAAPATSSPTEIKKRLLNHAPIASIEELNNIDDNAVNINL